MVVDSLPLPVPAVVASRLSGSRPECQFLRPDGESVSGVNPDAIALIRECEREIEGGGTGWYYVRECFGGVSSGWDVRPVAGLPGVVWSQLATGGIDPIY